MKGIRPDETGDAQDVQSPPRPPMISRRKFVLGSGLTGILAVLLQKPVLRLLRSTFRTEAVAASPPQGLTEGELSTLSAFAYVLIPSSFEARRADADPVVQAILQQHSKDAKFGAAATLLDTKSIAMHQFRFTEVSVELRRGIVSEVLKPYTQRTLCSNPYYYFTDDGRRIRNLWEAVAKPIIGGFYDGSLGWQVVGNSSTPGECSNLIDYQFAGKGRRDPNDIYSPRNPIATY